MLGLSVMGFVSVIFNYILRCINGGLLNVMFTPKNNETPNETTYEFGMNQERLMSYVKGLLTISGDDLLLDVLETFPESIGGGEAGVEEAQENPNREVIFIIGPVVAAILMLIAIIGLILISFCTCATSCCHCSKGKKRKRDNRRKKSHTKSTKVDKAPDVVEVVNVQEQEKTQQVLPYSEPFNNGYDGYAYYGSDSDTDSESDSTTTYEDDEPKSFMENVKDIFPFNKAAALESMVEERQEKIMKKVEEVAERSEFVRTHQGCFCCGCHLLTMLLAVVYVVGLVVFAIVCIMAVQQVAEVMEQPPDNEVALEEQVENWLGNKTSHYNLAGTLSFILQKTRVLLNETVTNLFTNLRGTVGNLEGKMNTTIKDDLEKLLARLQERSGLSGVFTETVDLSSRLSNLTQLVETTIVDHNFIVTDLEDLVKKFDEIHSKLEKSCASTKCSYEKDLKVLLIDFRKDNVNKPSNPEVIKNVDENFKKFATSIEELREEMAAMPSQLVAKITSEVNFAEKIDSFQANISETLNEFNPKIEELNVNVKKYISGSRKFVNPALYATAVVMVIIAIIFSVCLLLFIVEAFHRRLFSPTGKTPSQLAEVFRTKRRSHICGGCRFLTCSILFILLIVLSLLAAVVLVVCSILAVEVCPYVYMEKGMNQSDYVLNSILAGKWPTIQQQQGEFLEIAPPRDILYGLSVVCVPTDKTDPKLLPSVG
ncbi:unnamed protein product, partial [Taenia asiatica]|uniref:Conserved plasma membrane protein n=1 Tax=Taenia asiatica TaxID=60517 RepID=A0A0R3VTV3_TAEAS